MTMPGLDSLSALTYRYRLLPTRTQHKALAAILETQRILYNAALEERILCWRATGKTRTYFDQCKALVECRRVLPEMAELPANLQRGTLQRLDQAFKGFFRRVKAGEKPGFPRFKGRGWFNSFEFAEFSGLTFDGKRLRFKGLPGGLWVHMHRPLPDADVVAAKFKRDVKGWFVCLVVRAEPAAKRGGDRIVGLDLGLSCLATGSDGLTIPNPRAAERVQKEMRRRQRELARAKRGSARRMKVKAHLARLHLKIKNSRNTALHQASAMLVNAYDVIALENLNVKGLARSKLARSVNDAAWGKLKFMIGYKAARAGIDLREVDPRNTTQECSRCGALVPKALSERVHACEHCGLTCNRDLNAARVILHRAVGRPAGGNVTGCGERRPRNVSVNENTDPLLNGGAYAKEMARGVLRSGSIGRVWL
jgi:putative transposase